MSCFYILEISLLTVISFAVIFSDSQDCLLIFFIVSLAVQKACKFNYVPLVGFFFFDFHYSQRWVKEDFALISSKSVLPMFSSKSFIVSGLAI